MNTHPLDCPIELKKAARMAKKHLKAVFEHCDADGSGQLSRVEMVAAIQEEFELDFDNLNQELLHKLENMYNKMDQDQNGEISPKGNCSLFSRIDDELKILFLKEWSNVIFRVEGRCHVHDQGNDVVVGGICRNCWPSCPQGLIPLLLMLGHISK